MRIDKTLTAAGLAISLALSGGAAIPAFAQETPPVEAPEAPTTAPEAANFSDEKLESFVDAALVVSEIQSEAVASMSELEDEAAQAALVEKANADMAAAIEGTPGITMDEYVAVATAAEVDPALRDRLEGMIVAQQTQ